MDLGGQGMEDEQNNNERKMIRRPAPSDADKWNALPEVPKRAGKLEAVWLMKYLQQTVQIWAFAVREQ